MKQNNKTSVINKSFFARQSSGAGVRSPDTVSDNLAKVHDSLNKIAAVIDRVGYSESIVVLDAARRIESVFSGFDNTLTGPDVSS